MIVPAFEYDTPRQKPYVWVTWIAKLLGEEDRCWWKVWYKSRYHAAKLPEEPGGVDWLEEYNKKHDAIVQIRAGHLGALGYTVQLEDQNSFTLRGQNADLSGKPDIVAIKGDSSLIVDAKSGKRRQADHWQVLIYLFGLPLSWLKTTDNHGEVEYKDQTVSVRPLGPVEREAIIGAVKKVTGSSALEAEPSSYECSRCDIAKCPVRYASHEGDASKLF